MIKFFFKTLLKLMFKKHVSIEEGRIRMERSAKLMGRLPKDILVESVDINGVYAEWIYVADADNEKVILYLHGGGYVVGSTVPYRRLCASLSQSAKARVLIPEYRLAPEHPFPAGLEDAVAAYNWLLVQGVDAKNIVIAGDSAGGGLSLATILSLRDAGQPLPAGLVCISPWADLTQSGKSHHTNAKSEVILLTESLDLWASAYADESELRNPLVSPVFADFSGFPPLLIQAGSDEILLDDSIQLAEKAKAAGVDVTLSIYEGMWHVWHTVEPLRECREAFEEIGAFVNGLRVQVEG